MPETIPPLLMAWIVITTSLKNRKVIASAVGDQYVALEEMPDDEYDESVHSTVRV